MEICGGTKADIRGGATPISICFVTSSFDQNSLTAKLLENFSLHLDRLLEKIFMELLEKFPTKHLEESLMKLLEELSMVFLEKFLLNILREFSVELLF